MIIDVEFSRGQKVLTKPSITLDIDQAANMVLSSGRTRLEVKVWIDQSGIVFVAGPIMNRSLTDRWRSASATPNRWLVASPYSPGIGSRRWKCRYRIHADHSSRRARMSPKL